MKKLALLAFISSLNLSSAFAQPICILDTGLLTSLRVFNLQDCIDAAQAKLGRGEIHSVCSWTVPDFSSPQYTCQDQEVIISSVKYDFQSDNTHTRGKLRDREFDRGQRLLVGACFLSGQTECTFSSKSSCEEMGGRFDGGACE